MFVLGYGLHRADLYRNVPRVVIADRDGGRGDPDAYVEALYANPPIPDPRSLIPDP